MYISIGKNIPQSLCGRGGAILARVNIQKGEDKEVKSRKMRRLRLNGRLKDKIHAEVVEIRIGQKGDGELRLRNPRGEK
jgi:hypothetical protein